MKPYIDFNTVKRTESVKKGDKLGKELFKLMNNAVFGKSMENTRNRIDYELCDDLKRLKKLTSDPRFNKFTILRAETKGDDGLVGISRIKNKVELNKPVYAGLTILDNSKLNMYEFHYEYIKPKYGNKSKLLFTDTDSLCYYIETDDLYKDFQAVGKDRFDFSNYSKTHSMYNNVNESQLGYKLNNGVFRSYFKDETEGVPIVEFVGVRAKMYSCLMPDDKNKATCKGVKKSAAKRINHTDYVDCVVNQSRPIQNIEFYGIRSYKHKVKTIKINKTSLNVYDDKRYIIDGINSYSYGHYKTV